MTLELVDPGPLTTVQDVVGRTAWRRFGVPAGGAVDPWSARLANRLVGNVDEAALLELAAGIATLRVDAATIVALTGGLVGTADGLPLPVAGRAVRAGTLLRLRPGRGARGYLAVAGGIAVEPVLGSASTDLRTGFGGHGGRALRVGDRLTTLASGHRRPRRWLGRTAAGPIRVTEGPDADPAIIEALVSVGWRVGVDADRAGMRLDGEPLRPARREVPSMGLPLGAIQVPPDGRPIVMLADRPVTGGYPVPAVVIGADIGRVAQLRPGDALRFASVTPEVARDALAGTWNELAALETLEAPTDDELGWAGSHE